MRITRNIRLASTVVVGALALTACGSDDGGGEPAADGPTDFSLCVESEFSTREDSLPGLEAFYDFDWPDGLVQVLDTGVVYTQTDSGNCTYGEVFTSDGRIAALGLEIVEDDLGFFPPYNPSVTIRDDKFQENDAVGDLFAEVSSALDLDSMQAMNERASVDGELPESIATDWLAENGFTGDDGSLAADYDLSGISYTIGSKDFDEQLVLGHIALQALEAAGADVNDQIGLAGTAAARDALLAGEIDLYWEYNGTGWGIHLGNELGPDALPENLTEEVAALDLEQNAIRWLEAAPFNNTYALAVREEVAGDVPMTISEIAAELDDEG